MSEEGFVLFGGDISSFEGIPSKEEEEANQAAIKANRARFKTETAARRILPARRQFPSFSAKEADKFRGVFGYEQWIKNPLLARLPCHGKIRTAGVDVILTENKVDPVDPNAAKKAKAHEKNLRRRHAKAAAKKAAREAAEAAAKALENSKSSSV